MIVHAFADGSAERAPLWSDTSRQGLYNTLGLAGGVLAVTTLLAWPMAWLVTRTDLRGRRWLSILAIVPLAMPGYLMAYGWRVAGGYGGPIHALTDTTVARPSGYFGALLAMSAYLMPYLFLTMRAGMLGIDPSLEEAARSLGHRRLRVWWTVVVPQLRPAYLAGAMLVVLHVISDFAVVTFMDYDTFSKQLYDELKASQLDWERLSRWGLLLLGLALVFIVTEMYLLRGLRLQRAGSGATRRRTPARLGWRQGPAWALFAVVFMVSIAAPLGTIVYWAFDTPQPTTTQVTDDGQAAPAPVTDLNKFADDLFKDFDNENKKDGVSPKDTPDLTPPTESTEPPASSQPGVLATVAPPLFDSVKCSLPAALIATALAVPIGLMRVRYPSRTSFVLERLPYLGYAMPAIVFALSLTLFCLWGVPDVLSGAGRWLYQSLPLLLYALALHFLPEAVGPIRSSLYSASPRLDEASRSLGRGRVATFFHVTLPVLRQGLIVAAALVFLSCMKELPLTTLLTPIGTHTLSMEVWERYGDPGFEHTLAPYALTILLFSSTFVGVLLLQGRDSH